MLDSDVTQAEGSQFYGRQRYSDYLGATGLGENIGSSSDLGLAMKGESLANFNSDLRGMYRMLSSPPRGQAGGYSTQSPTISATEGGIPITQENPLAGFREQAKAGVQSLAMQAAQQEWVLPDQTHVNKQDFVAHLKQTSKFYERQIERLLHRIDDKKLKQQDAFTAYQLQFQSQAE